MVEGKTIGFVSSYLSRYGHKKGLELLKGEEVPKMELQKEEHLLHSPARTRRNAITREKLHFWLRISATLRSPAVPKGTHSFTVPQRSCL